MFVESNNSFYNESLHQPPIVPSYCFVTCKNNVNLVPKICIPFMFTCGLSLKTCYWCHLCLIVSFENHCVGELYGLFSKFCKFLYLKSVVL